MSKKDNVKNPSKTEKESSKNFLTPMLDSSKKSKMLKVHVWPRKCPDIKLEEIDKLKKEKDKKLTKKPNKRLFLKDSYLNKWLKKKNVKLKKKLIIMSKQKSGPKKKQNGNNLKMLKILTLITLTWNLLTNFKYKLMNISRNNSNKNSEWMLKKISLIKDY